MATLCSRLEADPAHQTTTLPCALHVGPCLHRLNRKGSEVVVSIFPMRSIDEGLGRPRAKTVFPHQLCQRRIYIHPPAPLDLDLRCLVGSAGAASMKSLRPRGLRQHLIISLLALPVSPVQKLHLHEHVARTSMCSTMYNFQVHLCTVVPTLPSHS